VLLASPRPDTATTSSAPGSPCPVAVDELCQALLRQATLHDAVRTLLQTLREQGGALACALAWQDGQQVRLADVAAPAHLTTSFTTNITPGSGSPHAAWLAAMEEALDQGQILQWPSPAGQELAWVSRAHQQLAHALTGSAASGASALTLILPGPADALGALTMVWREAAPAAATELAGWHAMAERVAAILQWQRQASRPWHWHVRQASLRPWQRQWAMLRANPFRGGALALGALAVLTLLPLPEHAGGQARVEGAMQRVLVATHDGFIKQVHAQPGDQVKANQVLADLAEQDLKLEREKWASQAAQQDNAYAAAMTRADRAEAALAMSRLEEAQAQLALVDEQLQRTQLRAPFDGVLIQGDLTQSIGAPVKQGDTLMTVASTQRWRVIVEIDEADIAHVKPGQEGEMALSSLPWDTLPVRVKRITPVAQARDGRNLFEVEAEFTAAVPKEVRPGLMGQAKLRIGHRPLLWKWLRPVVERARLGLWSWWG
jgi:multidrug efflux pump subunit AcrA (membrane-fusion protein)